MRLSLLSLCTLFLSLAFTTGSICTTDTDCVPARDCHPTQCVHHSDKQLHSEPLCTDNCAGMDCGAGRCVCRHGVCQVHWCPVPKAYEWWKKGTWGSRTRFPPLRKPYQFGMAIQPQTRLLEIDSATASLMQGVMKDISVTIFATDALISHSDDQYHFLSMSRACGEPRLGTYLGSDIILTYTDRSSKDKGNYDSYTLSESSSVSSAMLPEDFDENEKEVSCFGWAVFGSASDFNYRSKDRVKRFSVIVPSRVVRYIPACSDSHSKPWFILRFAQDSQSATADLGPSVLRHPSILPLSKVGYMYGQKDSYPGYMCVWSQTDPIQTDHTIIVRSKLDYNFSVTLNPITSEPLPPIEPTQTTDSRWAVPISSSHGSPVLRSYNTTHIQYVGMASTLQPPMFYISDMWDDVASLL